MLGGKIRAGERDQIIYGGNIETDGVERLCCYLSLSRLALTERSQPDFIALRSFLILRGQKRTKYADHRDDHSRVQ